MLKTESIDDAGHDAASNTVHNNYADDINMQFKHILTTAYRGHGTLLPRAENHASKVSRELLVSMSHRTVACLFVNMAQVDNVLPCTKTATVRSELWASDTNTSLRTRLLRSLMGTRRGLALSALVTMVQCTHHDSFITLNILLPRAITWQAPKDPVPQLLKIDMKLRFPRLYLRNEHPCFPNDVNTSITSDRLLPWPLRICSQIN